MTLNFWSSYFYLLSAGIIEMDYYTSYYTVLGMESSQVMSMLTLRYALGPRFSFYPTEESITQRLTCSLKSSWCFMLPCDFVVHKTEIKKKNNCFFFQLSLPASCWAVCMCPSQCSRHRLGIEIGTSNVITTGHRLKPWAQLPICLSADDVSNLSFLLTIL